MTPARTRPERGWFVTLEGPEGAGKTTQAARLRDALEAAGQTVVLLREPGGTRLGELIRTLLLAADAGSGGRIVPAADALLFNAARAQLVAERIRPALAAGTTVLCSRFADSTLAYQGAGMGLQADELASVERFATGGLRPDLTLLLDLPVELGLARKRGEETRFEADFDVAFHARVREGFLALAAAEPDRFAVIDGTMEPDPVFAAIRDVLAERLALTVASARSVAAAPVQPAATSPETEPNAVPVRMNR